MVDAPALGGLNKVAFQKEIQFIYYNCNALNGLSDRTHVCPLMTQSGHSTSYGKTRMTQLLATAAFDEAAGRQSRCVHSMCLQAMHRKISNVEQSKVACNVRMRSDLPPHFLQSATECPVPAVPRGGGSSGGGSLGVVTRLVPDLSRKMPLRAGVDHGDPM